MYSSRPFDLTCFLDGSKILFGTQENLQKILTRFVLFHKKARSGWRRLAPSSKNIKKLVLLIGAEKMSFSMKQKWNSGFRIPTEPRTISAKNKFSRWLVLIKAFWSVIYQAGFFVVGFLGLMISSPEDLVHGQTPIQTTYTYLNLWIDGWIVLTYRQSLIFRNSIRIVSHHNKLFELQTR